MGHGMWIVPGIALGIVWTAAGCRSGAEPGPGTAPQPLPVAAADAAAGPLVIEADRAGAPLSKYVYGQFIEHLGRCIYGGIWAEMLEDRKFWYPVTGQYAPYGDKTVTVPFPVIKASPWEAIGAVTMAKQDPFVGTQTPRLPRDGGIRQKDLGVIQGKAYVGYVWLKADEAGAGPVEVSLAWGDGEKDRQTVSVTPGAAAYTKLPLAFTSGASTDKAILEIRARGGACLVGTVSLMPGDNVRGMRADTLAVLRQLDAPVYRWPGGNFVSGYDWKDGIGDRDRRPPRKNPAWTGVEHNDFGLNEFMDFCRELKTEPYIAVNSGQGEAASAVEELQYANGAATTPMGRLRAEHGHPEPYGVRFWGVGNEMYGKWQIGHMPLDAYVKKHNAFADALRVEDRTVQLVAVGDAGKWSEGMMTHCAGHMDLVSEHFYCQEKKADLVAHIRQIPLAIRRKCDLHRKYRRELESLKGKDIRIAMDEWNYWYGPHPFGELGTRYFLKDGLGIAAGIHEYARNSDLVFMANYAQTVNVIGCIKTTKTAAALETTGLVLQLYRHRYGTVPVATAAPAPLDAQAAWSADRRTLTVSVVNPTDKPVEVPLDLRGAKLAGGGTRWQIAGPDPMAYNDPEKPAAIAIEEAAVQGVPGALSVAPYSVTLFALRAE